METFNEHFSKLRIQKETTDEVNEVYEKILHELDVRYNDPEEHRDYIIQDMNNDSNAGNSYSSRHIRINSELCKRCQENFYIFVFKEGTRSKDRVKIRIECSETNMDKDGFEILETYEKNIEKFFIESICDLIDFYVLGKDVDFNKSV